MKEKSNAYGILVDKHGGRFQDLHEDGRMLKQNLNIIAGPELDSSGSGRDQVANSCRRKSAVNNWKSDAPWTYRNSQILCKPTYGPHYTSPL